MVSVGLGSLLASLALRMYGLGCKIRCGTIWFHVFRLWQRIRRRGDAVGISSALPRCPSKPQFFVSLRVPCGWGQAGGCALGVAVL